jgi:hypothetical protein
MVTAPVMSAEMVRLTEADVVGATASALLHAAVSTAVAVRMMRKMLERMESSVV